MKSEFFRDCAPFFPFQRVNLCSRQKSGHIHLPAPKQTNGTRNSIIFAGDERKTREKNYIMLFWTVPELLLWKIIIFIPPQSLTPKRFPHMHTPKMFLNPKFILFIPFYDEALRVAFVFAYRALLSTCLQPPTISWSDFSPKSFDWLIKVLTTRYKEHNKIFFLLFSTNTITNCTKLQIWSFFMALTDKKRKTAGSIQSWNNFYRKRRAKFWAFRTTTMNWFRCWIFSNKFLFCLWFPLCCALTSKTFAHKSFKTFRRQGNLRIQRAEFSFTMRIYLPTKNIQFQNKSISKNIDFLLCFFVLSEKAQGSTLKTKFFLMLLRN